MKWRELEEEWTVHNEMMIGKWKVGGSVNETAIIRVSYCQHDGLIVLH